jgi:hypothetical protein
MGEGRKRAWADVKGTFKTPKAQATVCARADLAAEYDTLLAEYEQAKADDRRDGGTAADEPKAPLLADKLLALREEMLDSNVTFVFQGLGRLREQELIDAHPPTNDQKKEITELLVNPDTYIPALLHAACVEPEGMTLADWTGIWNEWTDGQTMPLRRAAQTVNKAAVDIPKAETVWPSRDG